MAALPAYLLLLLAAASQFQCTAAVAIPIDPIQWLAVPHNMSTPVNITTSQVVKKAYNPKPGPTFTYPACYYDAASQECSSSPREWGH